MKTTNAKTTSDKKLAEIQEAIYWYHQIVGYLLNRAEHLPPAIRELIREASSERYLAHVTKLNLSELAKKLEEQGE